MSLHGLSDAFVAAVAGDQKWAVEVLVKSPGGQLLEDITDAVLVGSNVTTDETRQIRRQCQLNIDGSRSDLLPTSKGDLLHPATGNELWISRGVEYTNGSTELAPLGVFRTSKPGLTDTDVSMGFVLNGNDRSSVVSRIPWLVPFTVQAGTSPGGVIEEALNFIIGSIYPGLNYIFSSVIFQYPLTTWGATPSSGSDPMADLITFAASPGCELFFDVIGEPTFRPIVNSPAGAGVVDAIHFVEGENCAVVAPMTRTIDETSAHNGVALYCNGTGIAGPFVQYVWDENSASPTYYLGVNGKNPLPITTTQIPAGSDTLQEARAKATVMASQQLQLVLGAMDDLTITHVPNPGLREGDAVHVTRKRLGVDADYIISSMTIPLDPETPQTTTFRPQVQTT